MIRVVLLAYNEASSIAVLMEEVEAALGTRPHELFVVDDGSTDGTAARVSALRGRLPVELLRHERNLGVGRAFDTGLRRAVRGAAPGDVVVTMEGDRTNSTETLPALLDEMDKGFDVVCASRYAPGGRYVGFPWTRRLISLAANWTMRAFFGIPGVRDYTIFFRAYRAGPLAEAMRRFGDRFIERAGFTANAEILFKVASAGPLRCSEVPLVYRYDLKEGRSKMRILSNMREYARLFARLALRG